MNIKTPTASGAGSAVTPFNSISHLIFNLARCCPNGSFIELGAIQYRVSYYIVQHFRAGSLRPLGYSPVYLAPIFNQRCKAVSYRNNFAVEVVCSSFSICILGVKVTKCSAVEVIYIQSSCAFVKMDCSHNFILKISDFLNFLHY